MKILSLSPYKEIIHAYFICSSVARVFFHFLLLLQDLQNEQGGVALGLEICI